ncbi:hypothetical protein KKA14_18190 [bacterium]|nr:hypothetical protein [bacterium]
MKPSYLLTERDLKEFGLICERLDGFHPVTNIKHEIVCHSSDGFEWGHCGSGPSDLALNILHVLLPVGCDDHDPVKLIKGQCSQIAFELHHRFKWDFIESMDREGGIVPIDAINSWIKEQMGSSYQGLNQKKLQWFKC